MNWRPHGLIHRAPPETPVDALERAGYRAFHESASGYEFSFLRPDLLPGVPRVAVQSAE